MKACVQCGGEIAAGRAALLCANCGQSSDNNPANLIGTVGREHVGAIKATFGLKSGDEASLQPTDEEFLLSTSDILNEDISHVAESNEPVSDFEEVTAEPTPVPENVSFDIDTAHTTYRADFDDDTEESVRPAPDSSDAEGDVSAQPSEPEPQPEEQEQASPSSSNQDPNPEFEESTDIRNERVWASVDEQLGESVQEVGEPGADSQADADPESVSASPSKRKKRKKRKKKKSGAVKTWQPRRSTMEWVRIQSRARTGRLALLLIITVAVASWAIGLFQLPGLDSPVAGEPWAATARGALGFAEELQDQNNPTIQPIDLDAAPPDPEPQIVLTGAQEQPGSSFLDEIDAGERVRFKPVAPQTDESAPRANYDREAAIGHFDRAKQHLADKNVGLAIAELESAIEKDPTHGDSYVRLGVAYGAAGKRGDAIRVYQQFFKNVRSHPEAANVRQILDGYLEQQ